MKKIIFHKIAIATLLLFYFSSSNGQYVHKLIFTNKTEMLNYIDKVNMKETLSLNDVVALISMYDSFVSKYSDDTINSAQILFDLGCKYKEIGLIESFISIMDRVQNKYPFSEQAPLSMFLTGFYYENDIKNIPKAKEIYSAFLVKYQKDPLCSSVKFSLDHIDLSNAQLVDFLINNNLAEDKKQNYLFIKK